MASKQNVLLHYEGIETCKQKDWLKAIAIFNQIESPSAVIYFNIGCCHLHLQRYEKAEKSFLACVERDGYLAVGYFQLAVAQTLMKSYEEAIENFDACLKAMRNNKVIHYKQLNLPCKLYACEVRLNLSLLYLFKNDHNNALEQLKLGAELENDSNHFIHIALASAVGNNWNVLGNSPSEKLIMLDSNAFFHPSKAKLDGIKADVKFRNSAKVVSATNDDYSFVGFVGPVKLQREKESLADRNSDAILHPPVPSVAPPRKLKPPSVAPPPHPPATPPPKLSALKNIPSPPSSSPPPLRKNRTPPPKQPPYPPPAKHFESEIAEKLRSRLVEQFNPNNKPLSQNDTTNTISFTNASSPGKSRPPPPKKGSFKFNFHCDLTTTLSIPKAGVKTYDEFVSVICDKLHVLTEEIKSGSTTLSCQLDDGISTVNSVSWREILLNGAKNSNLKLFVKETGFKHMGSLSPINRSLSPSADEEVDGIYVQAQFAGDEDEEVYTATVY